MKKVRKIDWKHCVKEALIAGGICEVLVFLLSVIFETCLDKK